MWLDVERPRFGRPALSVELLYSDHGAARMDEIAPRVNGLLEDEQVQVLVRVDVRPGQCIPSTGDFEGKWHYTQFVRQLALHPVLGRVHGIIVGNEPNLSSENTAGGRSFPPDWYMKVHSGTYAEDSDEADVRTQLRQAGYQGDILIAAVAPWSDAGDGTLDWYPTPPGARAAMHWHRYLATVYWLAFNASRLTREEVKGTLHTYSNVLLCRDRELDPALEPTYEDDLRLDSYENCQYGIRVYEEFRQQMETQSGGEAVPHYVTEWNSLVGRTSDALDDPAWPCNSYPEGLLRNAVEYMAGFQDLLGLAIFVDRDPAGGSPFWRACAAKGHLRPVDMNEQQRRRLRAWDQEIDQVFRDGWRLTTATSVVTGRN
jgi:hypothetical protein